MPTACRGLLRAPLRGPPPIPARRGYHVIRDQQRAGFVDRQTHGSAARLVVGIQGGQSLDLQSLRNRGRLGPVPCHDASNVDRRQQIRRYCVGSGRFGRGPISQGDHRAVVVASGQASGPKMHNQVRLAAAGNAEAITWLLRCIGARPIRH
jgi:hypothetical protein